MIRQQTTKERVMMKTATMTDKKVTYDFFFNDNESEISIHEQQGIYVLHWTDLMVNEWTEFYPSLSQALMRFASLVECSASAWSKGFTFNADEFLPEAQRFLDKVVG